MAKDRREDAGEFYPGGKVIATRPVKEGGDMKHCEFSNVEAMPQRFTENQMRDKINEVIRLLKGGVAAVALFALPVLADVLTVQKAEKGSIYNDEPIVTNVVFDASAIVTTNQLAEAVAAKADAEKRVTIDIGGAATNLVVRPVYANVNLVIRECETANGQKQYRIIRKEN